MSSPYTSCTNPCCSSKSMYRTSKRLGQSGRVCPCWPHRKHTRVLGSFGRDGVDALGTGGTYLEGFEVVAIGGAYCEMGGGGLGSLVGSLRNMLLLADDVSGCVAVRKAIRKASFAM